MNPSFDNVDLVDYAAAELFGSPASRTQAERLPDVCGEFFQVHPSGGREILVRGVLASSLQSSAALASADLKTKLRARQERVGTVGTYQGTDSQPYAGSLLLSYEQRGAIEGSSWGAGVQALALVEARVFAQP